MNEDSSLAAVDEEDFSESEILDEVKAEIETEGATEAGPVVGIETDIVEAGAEPGDLEVEIDDVIDFDDALTSAEGASIDFSSEDVDDEFDHILDDIDEDD